MDLIRDSEHWKGKVSRYLLENGMTIADFARKARLPRNTVSRLINSKKPHQMSFPVIAKIAEVVDNV